MEDESRAELLREGILRRESGAFAALTTSWLLIGLFAAINVVLPARVFTHGVPRYIAMFAVGDVVWAGIALAYALRSLRPLAFALPVALFAAALSWRVFHPRLGEAILMALASLLYNGLATGWRLYRASTARPAIP